MLEVNIVKVDVSMWHPLKERRRNQVVTLHRCIARGKIINKVHLKL